MAEVLSSAQTSAIPYFFISMAEVCPLDKTSATENIFKQIFAVKWPIWDHFTAPKSQLQICSALHIFWSITSIQDVHW